MADNQKTKHPEAGAEMHFVKIIRFNTWLVLASTLILCFQNCGPSFKALKSAADFASEADVTAGKALCTNPDDVAPSSNVRLTKPQLVNTLTDLFGSPLIASVQSSLGLVPEDSGAREWRFNSDITPEHAQSYVDLAYDIASKVFNDPTLRNQVLGSCASVQPITSACIGGYLDGFAKKIFRRPLTAEEKANALAFFAKSTDTKEGIVNLLTLHLASPEFLIRWELGDDTASLPKFKLTNYELASRISYDLTNSMPDDQLFALAQSDGLSDPNTLLSEAHRLAETPRGKYKIRQMFYGWLDFKESFDYSSFGTDFLGSIETTGLAKASLDEIDEYLNYIVFEKRGSFQDLMTSKLSFARHAGLATIYGHDPVTGTTPAVMTSGREGILSRLSYLFANTTRSNIIVRGVTFRRNVLCQNLPSPSASIIATRNNVDLTEEQIVAMTNKDFVAYRTSSPVCQTCHAGINPTGLAFEVFDSLGRLRTEERIYDNSMHFVHTMPIDSTAVIPWDRTNLSVLDANDLASKVSRMPAGQACFAKNIYQFIQARDVEERDGCHLNETAAPIESTDGSIFDAFVNAAVNRGTPWKRVE